MNIEDKVNEIVLASLRCVNILPHPMAIYFFMCDVELNTFTKARYKFAPSTSIQQNIAIRQ